LSDQILEDRIQVQFSYPPKREAAIRKRLYNDVLTFLERPPEVALGEVSNSYVEFSRASFVTLSQELSEFDAAYTQVPIILRIWETSTRSLLDPHANLFASPEELATSYAPEIWDHVLTKLPQEWRKVLGPAFRPKMIPIYD
jgi:hypothetical protein